MLCFLVFLFLLIFEFEGLSLVWGRFVTFLLKVDLFEGDDGAGLKFVNVLLNFGDLLFVLDANVAEDVIGKLSEMDGLAFYYVVEISLESGKLERKTSILIEDWLSGFGDGGV